MSGGRQIKLLIARKAPEAKLLMTLMILMDGIDQLFQRWYTGKLAT